MKELKKCLVCGNEDLKVYCDLGQMPLVNNLKESQEQEDLKFPLVVNECLICTHKQLSIAVEPSLLYSDYLYQSGVSNIHKKFFRIFSNETCLSSHGRSILDIGCNDGSLLESFKEHGFKVIGVEPCYNLASECDKKGIEVINDFFPTNKLTGEFDVITAFNVLAHNDEPQLFLFQMAQKLKEHGRIYVLTTPSRLDNYYHEHISYFTLQSMVILASKCGVEIASFKKVSMHGESYLFEMKKKEDKVVRTPQFSNKEHLVAYGASASEIVLFNIYKLYPEYIIDDNPLKVGKYIPGINSPIYGVDFLKLDKRNLTIIVAHNLFDEISAKIKKMRPKMKDKLVRLI